MKPISLVCHESIQNSPTNKSSSKCSFKFSKSKRFRSSNPQCPIAFYSNSSQKSKKMASIGSGNKLDMSKILPENNPAPNVYNTDSYYDFIRNKGRSVGCSRECSPDRSYLVPQIHKHPGSANYETFYEKNKKASCYTMRPKTKDLEKTNLSYQTNPGPGEYEAVSLDPKGKTKVSKFKGAQFGIMKLGTKRFSNTKQAPGPLSYDYKDGVSPNGRYVLSQRTGRGSRPFPKEERFNHIQWKTSKNPGPGDYEYPTEFGVYGDTAYNKQLATIV